MGASKLATVALLPGLRPNERERFDPRSVRWFLALYGTALVVNVATEAASGVWSVHEGRLYPWRHLPILPLYSTKVLALEWGLTVLAGVLLAAGRFEPIAIRLAAIVTFVSVLERYSNHAALLFLVAFFVALAPPVLRLPRADVANGERRDFEAVERPNLGLVRAQLLIVYVFGALNKIAHGFLRGTSLANLFGWSLAVARPLSWAVVIAELALPVLLVRRPVLGIAGVAVLHLVFAGYLAGLWSFALVMLAMAVLFLPPRPSPA